MIEPFFILVNNKCDSGQQTGYAYVKGHRNNASTLTKLKQLISLYDKAKTCMNRLNERFMKSSLSLANFTKANTREIEIHYAN